jgi:hypothetical protein
MLVITIIKTVDIPDEIITMKISKLAKKNHIASIVTEKIKNGEIILGPGSIIDWENSVLDL